MKVWLDVHLSPSIAAWLSSSYGIEAVCIRDLGMQTAEDEQVFREARDAGAHLMSKDADFVELVRRLGPPPTVVWVTCGNTGNARMREILAAAWPQVQELIKAGEFLVEITDVAKSAG